MPIIQHLGTAFASGGSGGPWDASPPFFDTTYQNGIASWSLSGSDIGNAPNHSAYSAGTDTYGDFIVFGPRDSRQDVRIYDAYTGSLVHTASLNVNANTYGVGMNSVNGKIYWTDYASSTAYMIDVSSHCSNNSSGTKLTWSSSTSSHAVTYNSSFYPWTGASNDSRCDLHQHLYFPNNTGHPFHNHWMISGRSSARKLWFFPDSGTQSSPAYTITWPTGTYHPSGCHGGSYDWQTNGMIVHDRDHKLSYIYGAGAGASPNTSGWTSFQSYTLNTNPSGYGPEDMIIRRDGAIVLMCSNTHKMTVYNRAS